MAHALPDSTRTIFTVTFWADALERITASAGAAAFAAMPITDHYTGNVDLKVVAVAFGTGALAEFFRSLAAAGKGNPGTASFIRATRAGATPGLVARFAGTKPPSSGPTPAATPPGGGPAA